MSASILKVREVAALLGEMPEAAGYEVEIAFDNNATSQTLTVCRSNCGTLGETRFRKDDLVVGSKLLIQAKKVFAEGREFLVASDIVGIGAGRQLVGYVTNEAAAARKTPSGIYQTAKVMEFSDGESRARPRVVTVEWCVAGCVNSEKSGNNAALNPQGGRREPFRRWQFVTLEGHRESRTHFRFQPDAASLQSGDSQETTANSPAQGGIARLREGMEKGSRLGERESNYVKNQEPALRVLRPILVLAARLFG